MSYLQNEKANNGAGNLRKESENNGSLKVIFYFINTAFVFMFEA